MKNKLMKAMSLTALLTGTTGAVIPALTLINNNAMIVHAGEQYDAEEFCNEYVGDTQALFTASKTTFTYDETIPTYAEVVSALRNAITYKKGVVKSANVDGSGTITGPSYSGYYCYFTFTNGLNDVDKSAINFTSLNFKEEPGRYYITATEPVNEKTINFTIVIKDTQSPVASGKLNYVTSPHKVVTIEEILSNLSLVDETDGEITLSESNVVSNGYAGNESTIGNYDIVIEGADSAGNKTTLTITIMVMDLDAPVISGPEQVDAYMSRNLTIDDFKKLLTITDDVDTLTWEDLEVKDETYTSNKNKPGTYNIEFIVTDSAGNEGGYSLIVNVKDDIKPTITGSSSYQKGASENNLSIDGMLNALNVSDNVSTLSKSNLNVVSDTFTDNAGKVGTYKIVVNITDEAGNTSEDFTITIKVTDDIPPVFWASDTFFVHVDSATPLSNTQLAYVARGLGIVDNTKNASVQIIANEYAGNETTKGEYQVSVLAVYDDGTQNTGTFTLSVDSDFNEVIVIEADKKPLKWYEKAWNGIKSFFSFKWVKKIATPFKFIYRKLIKPLWEAVTWLWKKIF